MDTFGQLSTADTGPIHSRWRTSSEHLIEAAEALEERASSIRQLARRSQTIGSTRDNVQQHVPPPQQMVQPSKPNQLALGALLTSVAEMPHQFDPTTIFHSDEFAVFWAARPALRPVQFVYLNAQSSTTSPSPHLSAYRPARSAGEITNLRHSVSTAKLVDLAATALPEPEQLPPHDLLAYFEPTKNVLDQDRVAFGFGYGEARRSNCGGHPKIGMRHEDVFHDERYAVKGAMDMARISLDIQRVGPFGKDVACGDRYEGIEMKTSMVVLIDLGEVKVKEGF
ncbi:hypothetical protein LTR22_024679 [Elasticomyces elasticus]|nr:hypothetical protein LTR22_024679 [Elasticomyces elasticus]